MLVIIVDDEEIWRNFAVKALRARGMETLTFIEPVTAFKGIANTPPDAVVIDYVLGQPDSESWSDGLQLAEQVRRIYPACPIIMISAYAHKEQLRQAMRIGCDDFLERSTKLSEREFANAVSEAMMRRRALYPSLRPQKIVHGEMEVDVDGWIATWKGEEIPITTGQFRLLSQLVTHPGKYINYSALHSLSTGEHLPQQEAREMLKTQMRILRAKLRRITGREWIQNKHGVGYRWQWNTVPVDDKDELVDIPEDDL